MTASPANFCQEFITDVRVPDTDRIGEVDDGWTVGIRWMFYERMFRSSPYVTLPAGDTLGGNKGYSLIREVARDASRLDDDHTRELLGEARMLDLVEGQLDRRIGPVSLAR